MLCFSWSIAISTYNPRSPASPIFYVQTHTHQNTHTHTHTCVIKTLDGELVWRFIFLLRIKAANCSDMAPLDLGHYWGQSWEEPRNLQDLLVHRFFPYLLQRRYVATQSLTGVTVALGGGLNRAEASPCATNTDAFLCPHSHTLIMYKSLHAVPNTHTHTHSVRASSCSLLSQHTAGVRRSVSWAGWGRLADLQS